MVAEGTVTDLGFCEGKQTGAAAAAAVTGCEKRRAEGTLPGGPHHL